MRSPYTLEDPPPMDAPGLVVERTAWSLAADLWHDHLPDRLLGTDCATCVCPWPCATWEVADGIIAGVCTENPDTLRLGGRAMPGTPARSMITRTPATPVVVAGNEAGTA
ncbi:MAG: hypothetical protein WCA46_05100, partial [Actinocatenispora sp.]